MHDAGASPVIVKFVDVKPDTKVPVPGTKPHGPNSTLNTDGGAPPHEAEIVHDTSAEISVTLDATAAEGPGQAGASMMQTSSIAGSPKKSDPAPPDSETNLT